MTAKKIIVLHSNTSKIVEDEILRITNNQVDIVRIDSLSQNTEIGRIDGFNFYTSPPLEPEPYVPCYTPDKSRPYLKKKKGRS